MGNNSSGGKKNVILIVVAVALFAAGGVFAMRDTLFAGKAPEGANEAVAVSDEVVRNVSGGQPAQAQPDPPGPPPVPGSGRRAAPAGGG